MAVTHGTIVVDQEPDDTSLTGNVTIGASDTGLLILLGIGLHGGDNADDPAPTVTVGGVSATEVTEHDGPESFGGQGNNFAFWIAEGDLPSAGSQAYTVTWTSDGATGADSECFAMFVPLQGSETTAPTEFAGASTTGGFSSDPVDVDVSADDGDYIFAVGIINSNSGNRRVDWVTDESTAATEHLEAGPDGSNSNRSQGYFASVPVTSLDAALNVEMQMVDGSIYGRHLLAVVIEEAAGGTDATASPAAISTTTTVSATASGTADATASPTAISTTTTVSGSATGGADATAAPAAITTTTTVSASATGDTVADGTASPGAITTTTSVAASASGTTVVDATASPAAITTTTTVSATAVGGASGDATALPAAITTTTVVSGAASGTSVIDVTASPVAITTTVTVEAVASSAEALYYFTPPTRSGLATGRPRNGHEKRTTRNRLFRKLTPPPIGRTVLLNGSTYSVVDSPTASQTTEADAVYLGGHRHLVTFAEKAALEAAGVGGTFESA